MRQKEKEKVEYGQRKTEKRTDKRQIEGKQKTEKKK